MTPEEIKGAVLKSAGRLDDIEAMGLFGSVARGDASPRSDVDIFIVVPDHVSERDAWLSWNRKLREILGEFGCDITVLVYSLASLREISSWYVLRLASEGKLIHDPGGKVERLFKEIVRVAMEAGLVEEEIHGRKFWIKKDIRIGETFELRLSR